MHVTSRVCPLLDDVFQLTFLLLWCHTGGPFKRNPTWEQVMPEVDVTFRYLHMNMIFGVAQESYRNYIIQYIYNV